MKVSRAEVREIINETILSEGFLDFFKKKFSSDDPGEKGTDTFEVTVNIANAIKRVDYRTPKDHTLVRNVPEVNFRYVENVVNVINRNIDDFNYSYFKGASLYGKNSNKLFPLARLIRADVVSPGKVKFVFSEKSLYKITLQYRPNIRWKGTYAGVNSEFYNKIKNAENRNVSYDELNQDIQDQRKILSLLLSVLDAAYQKQTSDLRYEMIGKNKDLYSEKYGASK